LIEKHLRAIRNHDRYRDSMCVIFIERNYGGVALSDVISNVCQQTEFAPVDVVHYDTTKSNKPGFFMTDELKQAMVADFQRALQLDLISFAKESDFICHRPSVHKNKIKGAIHEFLQQCRRFREVLLAPTDQTTGITKKKTTGKAGGVSRDDLAICTMMCLHLGGKKRMEPAFRDMCHARGMRI